MHDFDRSTAQLRKCLHSDPDSKPCSRLLRRIKNHGKAVKKAKDARGKRQWNTANKVLGVTDETGVINDIKEDIADLKKEGTINEKCPQILLGDLQEMVCDDFTEVCSSCQPCGAYRY